MTETSDETGNSNAPAFLAKDSETNEKGKLGWEVRYSRVRKIKATRERKGKARKERERKPRGRPEGKENKVYREQKRRAGKLTKRGRGTEARRTWRGKRRRISGRAPSTPSR